MLKIEHLIKSYDERKAVDDLSLEIKPGEIFGFIGHNGAGKTTTIKSVVGLCRSKAGRFILMESRSKKIRWPAKRSWPISRIILISTIF